MDNVTSQDGADITPASVPKLEMVEKRIVYEENPYTRIFCLNHLYPLEEFMNVITEQLKLNSANYIRFDLNPRNNTTEVYIDFYFGREETDEEFNRRIVREKKIDADFILMQEHNEYIKFLSLKAKFENDLSSLRGRV